MLQQQTIRHPSVVFNDQTIAIGKDMVFTWIVWTVDDCGTCRWLPLSSISDLDLQRMIRDHIAHPMFPDDLRSYVSNVWR